MAGYHMQKSDIARRLASLRVLHGHMAGGHGLSSFSRIPTWRAMRTSSARVRTSSF